MHTTARTDPAFPHRLQYMRRPHDVGCIRAQWIGIRSPHQGLRRQMKNDLRARTRSSTVSAWRNPGYRRECLRGRSPTDAAVNKFGSVAGSSAYPRTCAPRLASQSASQPPLKPVCPVRKTRRPCHGFTTSSTEPSRWPTALRVSACPAACPSAARNRDESRPPPRVFAVRLRIGSCSNIQRSSCISPITAGERTKKPPLIQPPSPLGFSWNSRTLVPSMSRPPNRAGGCTAVKVTDLPCLP